LRRDKDRNMADDDNVLRIDDLKGELQKLHERLGREDIRHHQIAARLLTARLEAGISRAELAERCGFSEAQIEAWELGAEVLYASDLAELCNALDVSPDDLVGFRREH